MDFSPYSDVRKSLLAGKIMTEKVSTLVREIHIMKPNEMKPQVKTKERFPNCMEPMAEENIGTIVSAGKTKSK